MKHLPAFLADKLLLPGQAVQLSLIFFCLVWLAAGLGCAAAVVGGGAVGGYAVGTDERRADRMADDAAVATRVKTALIGEKSVKARNIDVDVVAGVVVLTGYVDSRAEVEKAGALSRSVQGVKQVKNELLVGSRSPGQVYDDKVLSGKIKTRLLEEPGIKALNIDVDVYSGTASLTGLVANQEEKKKIIGLVRAIEGVKGVIDNLFIH